MQVTNTIKDLIEGLKKKEFSAVELANFYIDRIEKYDSKLNSVITKTFEQALVQAKEADKNHGDSSKKLLGIPVLHKDIFCTKDVRTACGSRMLDNFIAPYDATVVEKMANHGAVMLGKTNMDEFAMGSSNETSFYGNVHNPFNLECVPGGSSGGASASLAARLAPGTTGTDTGGSIRQPASYCGITGLKPTYGRVSRYGMIAFASSLDQAGPFGQTAEDCAILLEAMSGYDAKDSTSANVEVPNYSLELNNSLKGKKVGLVKEFMQQDLGYTKDVLENTKKVLESLGATVVEISLPHNHLSVAAYYIIAPAECSSNLARYDGVRFGHRAKEYKDLKEMYVNSRDEGFGKEVKRRILIGTHVLSSGFYDAYFTKAQRVRRLISQDFTNAFKEVDVILAPTAPSVAFKIGEKTKDPLSMYLSDIFTIGANMAGLPALSMPAGMHNNLPIGMQLIGKHFKEGEILNVAHQFQLNTDWHKLIPGDFK